MKKRLSVLLVVALLMIFSILIPSSGSSQRCPGCKWFTIEHNHKDATCTQTGYDKYRCTRCRYGETIEIPKAPHQYGPPDEYGVQRCKVCKRGTDGSAPGPTTGNPGERGQR